MTDAPPLEAYERAAPPNGRPPRPRGADEQHAVERQVLSTVIRRADELDEHVVRRASAAPFSGSNHQVLAVAIGQLLDAGEPVDVHTLARNLIDAPITVQETLRDLVADPDLVGVRDRVPEWLDLVDAYAADLEFGRQLTAARELVDSGSHAAAARLVAEALDRHGQRGSRLSDRRAVLGGSAILDQPDDIPTIWGEGGEVLWAAGEPAMIAAPPGVGKTTLGQQVVLGLIGLRDEVLGYPLTSSHHRVLYLAMDRPRQIRRSFRRMVTDADRDVLDDRLVIREGPPPGDLASDPTLLVDLARANAATVIIVDSLKDAAVKLTDDETGGRVNRAIQLAIADGIEVLVLHHQRKGQGGEKPKKLEDVYGSVWITAGMGSVILLWGAAGDPLVELVHLKQPADEVGPLRIEHDHTTGTTTISRGFDLLRYLRLHPRGVTSREVAVAVTEKAQPSENDLRKARRKLEAAVERGIAHRQEPTAGGEGGSTPARYYPIETRQEPPA